MSTLRIMGLDVASCKTGWAVIDFDLGPPVYPKLSDYGLIKVPASKSVSERLWLFDTMLTQILGTHKPDKIFIEKPHVRFINPAMTLIKFVGVAELRSYVATRHVVEFVTATSVRNSIGSKSKEDTVEVVNKRFSLSLTTKDLDQSDAIALAWSSLTSLRKQKAAKEGDR